MEAHERFSCYVGPCASSRLRRQAAAHQDQDPGVFKRIDGKGYVAVIRVAGKQRKRNARTYEAARRIKRESETDRDRGELQERTTVTFLRYLDEWVERYRGQGRRGFRENTRDEYRRLIANHAHPYFSGKLKLVDVTTFELARFVDWLADEDKQGRRLADGTVANIVNPLRAALATAKREGPLGDGTDGLQLGWRHDEAEPIRTSAQTGVQGHKSAIEQFRQGYVLGVVGPAPAEFLGDSPCFSSKLGWVNPA